ncbi:hypothetical protein PR202_ga02606 [Eleusine coracana subsp. coracana]|uniref:Homeobox-leucine zipper protein n=1 Tax=Eleusine coracana subsp. coracana TaxID=191504 RepID=A0AAV5BLV8_ELECO|nr:hypothetical protein QOZ80_2AG0144260 [Eleusine coracana subsp. coracana]GJM86719.1 hypothetical protein PR202_ga02606 [Eleusine coracana subsp. coracana]
MDSGRLIFNTTGSGAGQMLFLDCGVGGPGGGMFHRGGGRPVLGLEEGRGVKRPFFTSPDELLEEEYYDEQLPEKKRRLTPEQVHLLERSFEEENKLEPERKTELARKLGLQPRQVAVWFQNRRARWKTKQLERDFDRLKASFDALRADHDALLQDNHRLRSQVVSLTEKLQEKEEEEGGAGAAAAEFTADVKVSLAVVEVEQAAEEAAAFEAQQVKSEDRLSTGSGGSAVVDTDALLGAGSGLAAVDSSVESYFPGSDDHHYNDHCGGMGGPVDHHCAAEFQSEEDDGAGSDEGCSYYPDETAAAAAAFFAGHAHHHHVDDDEDDGQISWWMWN